MKRNPNAVQNNTLIIPRRHSGPFFPHHPCAGTNSWWDLPQLRLVFVSPGMGKPHNPERFSKGFTPPGLGIKGVTVLSTHNVFAHWQIGFPWENIIHFTGKIKKKPNQSKPSLNCSAWGAQQFSLVHSLISGGFVSCSRGLCSTQPCSWGMCKAWSCQGRNCAAPVLSCSGLFHPPWLSAQLRDGFTAFPLPLWSCSSISVFPFSVTQTQERKAVPNYPKYASAIKAQTQNGEFILYPVISSNLPPAFSSAHRSHS